MRERRKTLLVYIFGFMIGFLPLYLLWSIGGWLYSSKGETFASINLPVIIDDLDSLVVLPEELPPSLVGATLAAEDADFFYHPGIDVYGIARAVIRNLRFLSFKEGGSTITQQLARNVYLSQTKTLIRKLLEVGVALQLERFYDKYEILAAYLSAVYMGRTGIGMKKAARIYTGKQLKDLDWSETVGLAGIIRSPGLYEPDGARFLKRANVIKELLLEKGLHNEEVEPKELKARSAKQEYIPEWLKGYIVAEAKEKLGIPRESSMGGEGYLIFSTIDPELQKAVSDMTNSTPFPHPATLMVRRYTGDVLAVGGGEYDVLHSRRQMGSAIKPFYYFLGFLEGVFTPYTLVADIPIKIGEWEPSNFEGFFRGPVTVKDALRLSLNVPSVRIFLEVGPSNFVNFMKEEVRLKGFYPQDLTMALGTVETTPWDALEAYTFLVNGGFKAKLNLVKTIRDRFGNVIYVHSPNYSTIRRNYNTAVSLASQRLRKMMREVVKQGTGYRASIPRLDVGGKTGTAQRDAWFFGWMGNIIGVVSLHWDEGESIPGGRTCAPLWRKALQNTHHRYKIYSVLTRKRDTRQISLKLVKNPVKSCKSYLPSLTLKNLLPPTPSSLLLVIRNMNPFERKRYLKEINLIDPELAAHIWNELKLLSGETSP